jgi:hypothetical protein
VKHLSGGGKAQCTTRACPAASPHALQERNLMPQRGALEPLSAGVLGEPARFPNKKFGGKASPMWRGRRRWS